MASATRYWIRIGEVVANCDFDSQKLAKMQGGARAGMTCHLVQVTSGQQGQGPALAYARPTKHSGLAPFYPSFKCLQVSSCETPFLPAEIIIGKAINWFTQFRRARPTDWLLLLTAKLTDSRTIFNQTTTIQNFARSVRGHISILVIPSHDLRAGLFAK